MEKVIKDINLKVLVLEDSLRDLELIRELLLDSGYILDLTHVENSTGFKSALLDNKFDIILSDFNLPGFNAFGALEICSEVCPDVPFICVSGSIGEETAIELLKRGAVDYVLKDRLERLPFALKRALEEAKELAAHKKDALALKESENRFKEVAEVAQDWIWEVDKDGMLTYSSNICQSLLGYFANEIVGKKYFYDFFIPEKIFDLRRTFWDFFIKKEAFRNFETPCVKKNGQTVILLTSGRPILDENGNLLGYRGGGSDITEYKRVLKELMDAKKKAEESDKLKTAFINNISHEIRTPLNGILGFGQLMAETNISPEKRTEMYENMHLASNRLMNTVSDYLDMARIVSGTMDVNIKEFYLKPEFDDILKNAEKLCSEKKIDFNFQVPAEYDNLILKSDRGFILKIFEILLNNAIKFTNHGSITCGYRIISGYIEFFVKDTGKGIANDKLDIIFNMFSQEDPLNTRGYEGSGLGLSIARGLVKLLGGTINVVSEKDKGSEFTFKIPFSESVSTEKSSTNINTKFKSSEKSIVLVVEDDDLNFLYLEILLKVSGYKYLHAINGAVAVDICRQNPDLAIILMDIKMPVMDGMEATKLIREFNPEIPIIAITAFAHIGDEQRFLNAGCNEYLSKPISKNDLLEMLKKYI